MERVEIGHDRDQAPERGSAGAGGLHHLENCRAEPAKALADARGGPANVAEGQAGVLERRRGGVEVRDGDDDVVKADRPVGVFGGGTGPDCFGPRGSGSRRSERLGGRDRRGQAEGGVEPGGAGHRPTDDPLPARAEPDLDAPQREASVVADREPECSPAVRRVGNGKPGERGTVSLTAGS
ncbi:MAG: hypothetical protein M3022_08130 [Actinomycetota bacterium]|nr:hypothetical protein [Actinomycetota bacterium]